jgi:hypothetical protein
MFISLGDINLFSYLSHCSIFSSHVLCSLWVNTTLQFLYLRCVKLNSWRLCIVKLKHDWNKYYWQTVVFVKLYSQNLKQKRGLKSLDLDANKNILRGFSLRANYTDRATTACRRSYCQLLRIEGCHVVSATDPLRS